MMVTLDSQLTVKAIDSTGVSMQQGQLIVRLLPPATQDNSDAITHFQASVNDLFDYALRDVNDSDMVGITISNENNLLDRPIGISFRRKDQLSSEVIWSVFSKWHSRTHGILRWIV